MRDLPPELSWLASECQPGRLIAYSFRCPRGAAIARLHGELPEVKAYTSALLDYLEDGARHPRTSKLGAKRVLTLKNAMVTAVLAFYGRYPRGSKAELAARLRAAEHLIAQARELNSVEQAEDWDDRASRFLGL